MYVDGYVFYLNSIIKVLCIKYYDSFPPTISLFHSLEKTAFSLNTLVSASFFPPEGSDVFCCSSLSEDVGKQSGQNILQISRSNDS